MTNTTTELTAAGFIACDKQRDAIWGRGATEDAAWDDMVEEMRKAGIKIVDELSDDEWANGSETLAANYMLMPATAALLQQVDEEGGNIAWGTQGRIACTVAEDDA